ncbi:MAG TPA: DUF2383 domain-containing protein [Candidatus Melainabacteria bacterium]|nr:DUF2383 domain-containing protein [Candidatus Melainabacteria bacterium]
MDNEFVHEFNSLLAGERSSVETYDLALSKAKQADVLETLTYCRNNHMARVALLTSHVLSMGGTPEEGTGLWGGFEKFVQDSAGNERDAVAMLEQAEAERLVNYESQHEIVIGPVKVCLANELLPAQHETHLALSTLLKNLPEVKAA